MIDVETLREVLGLLMLLIFSALGIRYLTGVYKLLAFTVAIIAATILARLPTETLLMPIWLMIITVTALLLALACVVYKIIKLVVERSGR